MLSTVFNLIVCRYIPIGIHIFFFFCTKYFGFSAFQQTLNLVVKYSQKFETLMISSYISYPTDIFFLISDGLQLVGDIVPTLIGEKK